MTYAEDGLSALGSMGGMNSITRPKLLNKNNMHTAGIDRFGGGLTAAKLYTADLFHTMLNMPRWRFVSIFVSAYILGYVLFALLYAWQPDECIPGIDRFASALWFSVQTAATIGYGAPLVPNPACVWINLMVMAQTIFSSGLDYCLMGLVFARFSAPPKRSLSVRFSTCAVLHRHVSGYWSLSFRIANMRKHLMLKPEVQVLLALPDNPGQSCFIFEEMKLEAWTSAMANLKLGLAVTLSHIIRPDSPLWGLSLSDLEERDMEVVVFLDGIDAMTSNSTSARYSFFPGDIRINQRFATLYMKSRKGKLGLDFSEFDRTLPAVVGSVQPETGGGLAGAPLRAGRQTPAAPNSVAAIWSSPFSELTQRPMPSPSPAQPIGKQRPSIPAAATSSGPVVSVHALIEQLDRISPLEAPGEEVALSVLPTEDTWPASLETPSSASAQVHGGSACAAARTQLPPRTEEALRLEDQTSALLAALLADSALQEPLRRQAQQLQQRLDSGGGARVARQG